MEWLQSMEYRFFAISATKFNTQIDALSNGIPSTNTVVAKIKTEICLYDQLVQCIRCNV